ncbi:PfaD family polyunsaturated fatty acid/polyketide biosynthesis protein [Candidatus Uabimicrobium sp. HlEnr_7]|uniref:PfaD family polyunsaturated fatty acid/polyketide biosynthesis protein n=1 Tax=Candidatus Uabimicrobium helgolandensis TaxID=3095367 RepID=UPI003556BB25
MDITRLLEPIRDYKRAITVEKKDNNFIVHNGFSPVENSAFIPAMSPRTLGCKTFQTAHEVKYPYIAGAMANGIGSAEIVIAMARAGMLGFFGAGGLSLANIEKNISKIQSALNGESYGFNLLHSPFETQLEEDTVDLYLKHNITRVSASAYLKITPHIVYYRAKGMRRVGDDIVPKNYIFAKISRTELAKAFMSPPPQKILEQLHQEGKISSQERDLASLLPLAEDITAEADSGGHTDQRPLVTLLPTICEIRNEYMKNFQYDRPIRVGAAGGISTPQSMAAAFAMGADYVVTGSVNQCCVEADTSQIAKEMLCKAEAHDVKMAPAADMFEMGVKLQVLKQGTMFAMRADRLYNVYSNYKSIEEIPEKEKNILEKTIFRQPLTQVWEETKTFFQKRDPLQIDKAQKNPRHKMALIFRSYLGRSSIWAKTGEVDRKIDYQIWCGQAMGSFNEWVNKTPLDPIDNRQVADVAKNLLRGTVILNRINAMRLQGIDTPSYLYNIPAEKDLVL